MAKVYQGALEDFNGDEALLIFALTSDMHDAGSEIRDTSKYFYFLTIDLMADLHGLHGLHGLTGRQSGRRPGPTAALCFSYSIHKVQK